MPTLGLAGFVEAQPCFVDEWFAWEFGLSFPFSFLDHLLMPKCAWLCPCLSGPSSKAGKPQMFLVSSPQASVVNNSHGRERNSFHLWACLIVRCCLGTFLHHVFLTTPCGRYDHYPILHTRKPRLPEAKEFSWSYTANKNARTRIQIYLWVVLSGARTTLHPYIRSFIHSFSNHLWNAYAVISHYDHLFIPGLQ